MLSFSAERGRVDVHAAWTTAEVDATIERILRDWEHRLPADRDARIVLKPNLNNDLVALTVCCAAVNNSERHTALVSLSN
jgi:hypothetical protein